MRYALLSDIHGNLEALAAVLADCRDRVDALLCLGDVVGYGADPAACVQLVGERCQAVVAGNHEAAVTGRLDLAWFNPYARVAAEWTRRQLSATERAWLAALPLVLTVGEATLAHASPAAPEAWDYLVGPEDGFAALGALSTPWGFVGHSHLPRAWLTGPGRRDWMPQPGELVLEPGCRCIVNVGSVGQPRDGDPRAAYAIWDPEARRIVVRRVPYDVAAARRKIVEAGLPRFLADRLVEGR